MSLETIMPTVSVAVMALLHGVIVIVGLLLIKQSRNWLTVLAVTLGVIVFNTALHSSGYMLMGRERAASILLPSGEMFAFVFLPMLVSTVISSVMIMFTTYGLFVAPEADKNV